MKVFYSLAAMFFLAVVNLNADSISFPSVGERDLCCPPVSVFCPPCGAFLVTADYLYWKAHEEGLDFAIDGIGSLGGTPPSTQGDSKTLHWEGNSGFRVGAGYSFACLCWDLYLNYTRYTGKAKRFVSAPVADSSNATLWAVFASPNGGEVFFFGDADWRLRFQTLDLEIGRTFCFKNCFIFRPFGGLEGIWTKDRYNILYDDRPLVNFFQNVHHEQRFSGVGPRLGINNNWNFFNCLSLFADGALALVWGHFSIEREDIVNNVVQINTGDSFSTLRPIFDFRTGIRWDRCFCNRYHVFAKVAYEEEVFLKHNQFMRFTSGMVTDSTDIPKGNFWNIDSDLCLYGLTVSLGVAF